MRESFDDKIRRMAGEEKMVLPSGLERRIDHVLAEKCGERSGSMPGGKPAGKSGRVIRFRWGRAAALSAACVLIFSVTVSASVGLYRQRMEAMNHEKLEAYFVQIYQSGMPADTHNRALTEDERARMGELETAYRELGRFPEKELTMLDAPEDYQRGVAYLAATGTFFFPESEMTDEELLQYVDFLQKRDYSLAVINQKIADGEYVYEGTPESPEITDREILDSDAVYEPDRELTIAYEGDMGVQCMAAGTDAIYLGGYNRIERMAIGSGEAELLFEAFGEDEILVSALYQAQDGTIYAGVSNLSRGKAGAFGRTEIYQISAEGELLNRFAVGEREQNLIDSIAADGEGNLYVHTRMRETDDKASVHIYDAEGQMISAVQETDDMIPESAGLGQGKDGAVYVAVKSKNSGKLGLAKLEPTGAMSAVYADLQEEGENLVWDVVCRGVETDFILWGYDGVYTYCIGEEKANRIMAPYDAVCGFEGACVSVLPDGRMVFLNTTEGLETTLKNGAKTWIKNPEKTTLYYVPTVQ